MIRISRRQLSLYGAKKLLDGETGVLDQIAAYLVESRRTKELPLLVADLEKALENRGLVHANVDSTYELDAAEKDAIGRLLKERYEAQAVQLSPQTDESLLGGVVIRTATDEFDGSLKRSINRLRALKV